MSEGATGAKTAPVSPRGASEPPARQDHSAGRADAPAAGASAATPVPRKRGRDSDDEDEAGGAGGARGSKGGLPGGAGVDGAAGSAAATVDTADVADAPELKGQYVDQQWGFEHVEELVFSRRKLAKTTEELAAVEAQIDELESGYLRSTQGWGNVVEGFDGIVAAKKAPAIDEVLVESPNPDHRIFTRSSATAGGPGAD